jgi:excisionase family DNA binding protein
MAAHPEGPYTVSQIAVAMGVHVNTVRRWADDGDIKCFVTPGGHRRFTAVALNELRDRLIATSSRAA